MARWGRGYCWSSSAGYIARAVIDRYHKDGHLDGDYLLGLFPDAVAEIDKLPEPHRSCTLYQLAEELREPDPWYAYNIERERARRILARRPITVEDTWWCDAYMSGWQW